jgi:hypothetical protein
MKKVNPEYELQKKIIGYAISKHMQLGARIIRNCISITFVLGDIMNLVEGSKRKTYSLYIKKN